jgi:hypothetical protein
VGADIGKCPFDLSTVKHGFFLYIIILRRPTKTAAVNLHTGHADVPSGFQQGMPTAQKRQQGGLKAGQSVIPVGKLADVYGSRHGMSRTHLNFYFSNKINNLCVNVFFASNAVLRYVRSFLPQNQR